MNRPNIPANVRATLEEYGIELDPPSTARTTAHQIPRKTRDKNNEGTTVSHQQESKNMSMNIPGTNTASDVLSIATNGAAPPPVEPVTSVDVFDALCKRADKLGTLETIETIGKSADATARRVDALVGYAQRLETIEAHAAGVKTSTDAVAANVARLAEALKKKEHTLKSTLIDGALVTTFVAAGIAIGSYIGIRLARKAGLPVPALPVESDGLASIQA